MTVDDLYPKTPYQQATIDHFVQCANESGATIQIHALAGNEFQILETASADFDYEVTTWTLCADGRTYVD